MKAKSSTKRTTLWVCLTAMFMALNVAMSSFGVPVPGGHLYLNDIIICTAAIILDPVAAFIVGGVGAFLGDLLFYPAPMFVSLVTHGLQAIIISVFSHYVLKKHPVLASGIGVSIGGRYHGRRLFSRQSVYLQHPRIRPYEAALPVPSGCGRRGSRYAPVLEVRSLQAI